MGMTGESRGPPPVSRENQLSVGKEQNLLNYVQLLMNKKLNYANLIIKILMNSKLLFNYSN